MWTNQCSFEGCRRKSWLIMKCFHLTFILSLLSTLVISCRETVFRNMFSSQIHKTGVIKNLKIHCPSKVWKRPRKVGFWTISHFQAWPQAHFQAVQILFGEETVRWHHVCHGMASPITRPQPNWATRNWTVMSVRSVQPVWIIFGQSFRRLGVIYQVNVWINGQLGCPDYAEL